MKIHLFLLPLVLALGAYSPETVKTTFQTSQQWRPSLDNRADAVMVYGVRQDGTFESRVKSWREHGYEVQFMTGAAWGDYQDYFNGGWDGTTHFDEGQVNADGDTLWHSRTVPYVVPTLNYLNYLKERHIKPAIDAGVVDIFLEEPEFWVTAGYSDAFKREWKEYYGTEWKPQAESPEAMMLSGKLKCHLYCRALDELFSFAKEYGRSMGRSIRCYVPTHSLINYTQWKIVSPEAELASLECVDGYVAQVWTGTSRVPNYYKGIRTSRVFETAFLEYGTMASMIAPTRRRVFFLTDPIEDGIRDWDDYKRNYQATFTAQLLYPEVADYEVMPWPERIYDGRYRISSDSDETSAIPADYATMMQVMINSLNKMPASEDRIDGADGIGILVGNSLMFQHSPESLGEDVEYLSDFFGLALPLLKRGVPVRMVNIENLQYRSALKDMKLLLMTYSDMKPLDPSVHERIAEWVKGGGMLIYCGKDDDSFQSVSEWWNTGECQFSCPSDHLFALMGIPAGANGREYKYGRGFVRIARNNPREFVEDPYPRRLETLFVRLVFDAYGVSTGTLPSTKNYFFLQRGPYDIVAVMDETGYDVPLTVNGVLVDLFDPELPVIPSAKVLPGHQGFFIDMSRVDKSRPCVLAASGRESDERYGHGSYSFTLKGPEGTAGIARVFLPFVPERVTLDGMEITDSCSWDETSQTCLIRYSNRPDGVEVKFSGRTLTSGTGS